MKSDAARCLGALTMGWCLLSASCAVESAREADLAPPGALSPQSRFNVRFAGDSCRVPVELRNGRLMVELVVWHGDPARPESTRIRAGVDTGAQHALILTARTGAALGLRPESDARFTAGAGGARLISHSTVRAVDLGGARFEQFPAVVEWSAPASRSLDDGGREGFSSDENGLNIVGMGLLAAFQGVGIEQGGTGLRLAFGEPAEPGPGWAEVPMHGLFNGLFSPAFSSRSQAEAWLESQGQPVGPAACIPDPFVAGTTCRLGVETDQRPMPRTWATIDGERIEVVLDTGCGQDLYLFEKPARWRVDSAWRSSSAQDGHDRVFVEGRLDGELVVGPIHVARPVTCYPAEVHAVDALLGSFGRGLVGLETLTRRAILFDWKRRTLWVWDDSGPPAWPVSGPAGARDGQATLGPVGDWRIRLESATMEAWTSSPFKPSQG